MNSAPDQHRKLNSTEQKVLSLLRLYPKRRTTPLYALFFSLTLLGFMALAPFAALAFEFLKQNSFGDAPRLFFGLGLVCLGHFFASCADKH
jgi:hypothetical protein